MAPGAYAQSASGAERMAEDPVYRKLVADYAQATYFKGLSETEALQYLEGVHPTHAEYVAFIRLYPGSPKVPEFKKTIADFKAFAAQPDANSARSGFTGLPRSLFDDRCFEPGFETRAWNDRPGEVKSLNDGTTIISGNIVASNGYHSIQVFGGILGIKGAQIALKPGTIILFNERRCLLAKSGPCLTGTEAKQRRTRQHRFTKEEFISFESLAGKFGWNRQERFWIWEGKFSNSRNGVEMRNGDTALLSQKTKDPRFAAPIQLKSVKKIFGLVCLGNLQLLGNDIGVRDDGLVFSDRTYLIYPNTK